MRSTSPATPSSASARSTGCACTGRPRSSIAAAWSPSPSATSTPTTSPRCSTPTGSPSGPAAATTAPLLLRRLGVQATTRASFYLYSTTEEVDALVAGLDKVRRFFA